MSSPDQFRPFYWIDRYLRGGVQPHLPSFLLAGCVTPVQVEVSSCLSVLSHCGRSRCVSPSSAPHLRSLVYFLRTEARQESISPSVFFEFFIQLQIKVLSDKLASLRVYCLPRDQRRSGSALPRRNKVWTVLPLRHESDLRHTPARRLGPRHGQITARGARQ